MSHGRQLSLLPRVPGPAPGDPLPGYGQQEWGCGWVQVCVGTGTRGDAHTRRVQDCTHTGACRDMQTRAHAPWHTQASSQGAGTEVHAQGHTGAHLPRLTPCSMPTLARVCFTGSPRAAGTHRPWQTPSPHHVPMCQPHRGGDSHACHPRQCQQVTGRAQPDSHHGDIGAWAPAGLGAPRGSGGRQRWGHRGSECPACAWQRCQAGGRWCWRRR